MSSFYTGVTILTVLGLAVMSFAVIANYSTPKAKKYRFIISYVVIAIGAVLEWGAVLLETANSPMLLHMVVKSMELIVAPSIPLAIMMSIAEDRKMMIPMLVVVNINAALIIASCFNRMIFYIDSSNLYHHGRFYFLYNLSFSLGIIFLIISTLKIVHAYQSRSSKVLAIILVYLVVGLSFHLIKRTIWVNYLTISTVTIFMYIVNEDIIKSSDSLTKLLNRHSYDSLIDNIESEAAIINIDVDYFKRCNDTYGHLFGDEVLKEIASMIKICMSRYGQCFRTGGDEFCVLIRSKNTDVEHLLEIFHQKMAELRAKNDRLPFVSTGYSFFNPRFESIHDAIDRADVMMYKFKNLRKKLLEDGKSPSYMDIQRILETNPLRYYGKN